MNDRVWQRSKRKTELRSRLILEQGGLCFWCREMMDGTLDGPRQWTLDHVIPRSRLAKGCKTRIVAACRTCNEKRADSGILPLGI